MLNKSQFAKQIRKALENLHDMVYLQKLPLTEALSNSGQTRDQAVRQVRAELMDAIEQLASPSNLGPRARGRRPYLVLYGRYVQAMTTGELVRELAISVRQLRREHKRALSAVTDLMWSRLSGQLTAEIPLIRTSPTSLVTERREAGELEADQLIRMAHFEDLTISAIVRDLLPPLKAVAASRGINLENRLSDELSPVRADRILLRQVLMEIVSYAISNVRTGKVAIDAVAGTEVTVSVSAKGQTVPTGRSGVNLDISRRLVTGLGGYIETCQKPDYWEAAVSLPLAGDLAILVMDDNAGLVELFRRYLAGRPYNVLEAQTAEQALQQAREEPIKLIILDIMMPEQDGWEVLQRLRSAPDTSQTPILICSVLDEPEIASTLGASDYITKPVTQDALLEKVEHWCNALPGLVARPRVSPANSAELPST